MAVDINWTMWNTWSVENLPANIPLFEVNSRSTRKSCEICSKSTIKSPESFWCFYCSPWSYFTPFLVFLLVTLNKKMLAGILENTGWKSFTLTGLMKRKSIYIKSSFLTFLVRHTLLIYFNYFFSISSILFFAAIKRLT